MSKMLKTHRNTIGNLMITLLFVGGCIFLLTGSWNASETEAATGCCGGGGAALTSFAANNGGDFGSDIPMDAEVTGGCCGGEGKVIPSSSNSACTCLNGVECNYCDSPPENGCGTNSCHKDCHSCDPGADFCCTMDCKKAGSACNKAC